MRVNYSDLDIAKLLMAFLVVEIHARPLMEFPLAERIIEGIDVVAVPFFFMASAFLCFRGLDEVSFVEKTLSGAVRVRKTIGRLLKLYLIWTVLYLPVTVFGSVIHGDCLAYALAVFVRGTLLIGENYYSWPLWYLLASAVGFALVYICLRGGALKVYRPALVCAAVRRLRDCLRAGLGRCTSGLVYSCKDLRHGVWGLAQRDFRRFFLRGYGSIFWHEFSRF